MQEKRSNLKKESSICSAIYLRTKGMSRPRVGTVLVPLHSNAAWWLLVHEESDGVVQRVVVPKMHPIPLRRWRPGWSADEASVPALGGPYRLLADGDV